MNTQYLQYVREQLMVATADLSGETKGQLLALAGERAIRHEKLSPKKTAYMGRGNRKLDNVK